MFQIDDDLVGPFFLAGGFIALMICFICENENVECHFHLQIIGKEMTMRHFPKLAGAF